MKILLVDDEKKFVMMLAKRLALRGIDVEYAFTGDEALTKAKNNIYDVAILDIKMPGIGGIELERKLKALVPGLNSIFLTGHGSEADYTAGSAEAAHYLAKPLQIEKLIEILYELTE
ncbi:MAG: response regulator [Deltaproteobacteria bacterium]|nr:response regulator [Deltaproteobacteria bacterium]